MSEKSQMGGAFSAEKKQLVFLIVGVVLVALAPLTLILTTVPEMTPDGWFGHVVTCVLLLWFSVTVGLALIGGAYFPSNRARNRYLLVCFGVGFGVCFYPSICQLVAGEEEVAGKIERVVRSSAKDGFWISPQSRTVTKRRVRKYDVIRILSSSGELMNVKLIRADVDHLLSFAKEMGGKPVLKVVYLKQLKRLVSVEVANP